MDNMVWLDTMFPGIDEEEGWEENMKRVVNYDYLLKEYLDWQLKHLTTDNFDSVDWSNVTADLIHIASEYTDKAVQAQAVLTLQAAADHVAAELGAYYTKTEADAKIEARATLAERASAEYADLQLEAYYKKTETDDMFTDAKSELKLYADAAVASIDLSAYYKKTETDDMFTDAKSELKLYADDKVASIDLSAYYKKTETDDMFTDAKSELKLYADDKVASIDLTAYYRKDEIGDISGYTSAIAKMEAYVNDQISNIDLSATYYTKQAADEAIATTINSAAELFLQAAAEDTTAALSAYYKKTETDDMFSEAKASLEAYANAAVASIGITAYYTKEEIGDFSGYETAMAKMQAMASEAAASFDIEAYYTAADVDDLLMSASASIKGYADNKIANLSLAAISEEGTARLTLMSGKTELGSGASMALSVTNNSNGYSTLALKAGDVTLATSGNITLGGDVIFKSTNLSSKAYKDSAIKSGIVSIIDGVVTADYVQALGVTAKTIKATGGAKLYGSDSTKNYMQVNGDGFDLYYKGNKKATLYYVDGDEQQMTLRLGDNNYAYVQKYRSNDKHYMWVGNGKRNCGLKILLSGTGAPKYELLGTAGSGI